MVYISIEQFTISKSSSKIEIEIINYTINSNAVARVNFLDADDKTISSVVVYITDDDFNVNWVNDTTLIDIIIRKLGLTRSTAV